MRTKQQISNYIAKLVKAKKIKKIDIGRALAKSQGNTTPLVHANNYITLYNRALVRCDLNSIAIIAGVLGVPAELLIIEPQKPNIIDHYYSLSKKEQDAIMALIKLLIKH